MKMIKTALIAVFAVFAFNTEAPAADLNALDQADVLRLTADLTPPLPRQAITDVITPKDGLDPVVITVSGLNFGEIGWGPLEMKHFLKIIKIFFPRKEISEADLVTAFVTFNKDYFFLENDEDLRDLAKASPDPRLPDNYLELKLKEIPGYANHNVIVAPFTWSRDPADTDKYVPELEKRIAEVHDAYRKTGRPVYILAHSWGSVLTHEALHRLGRYRPDVKIDKLITAGSPLVPANFVVKLFMKYEVKHEDLEKSVSKPAIVRTWRNIWAMRDAYSNTIPAADFNYQADADVENVEPKLIELILHSKPLKKDAKRDLFKIRNIKDWHGSYFYDYKASLKSLNKEIFVPVFRPLLAPQVVDCYKQPAAPSCPV